MTSIAGRFKPRTTSVLSQQSAGHREHTDVFGEPPSGVGIAKSAGHTALGHVQRVVHTLTALPRDAIDPPGHVTEDTMRPLPTETSSRRRHSIFRRSAVVS
ncbi:hypothetical protein CBS147354_7947 [Penicillium roqueforti]|nr:hypothetical protein CBS147354_7947 [Penicillium roqueforti]